jgi:hypothetical protein
MRESGIEADEDADAGHVSLVLVPRFVEADPVLEDRLRSQRHAVLGGVVVGQTEILPEDVRGLTRQLLTNVGKGGLLGELRNNLGAVETLIAAVFALFGVSGIAQAAPHTIGPLLSGAAARGEERVFHHQSSGGKVATEGITPESRGSGSDSLLRRLRHKTEPTSPKPFDAWGQRGKLHTRSGLIVEGIFGELVVLGGDEYVSVREAKVRVGDTLTIEPGKDAQDTALIRVDDIVLLHHVTVQARPPSADGSTSSTPPP